MAETSRDRDFRARAIAGRPSSPNFLRWHPISSEPGGPATATRPLLRDTGVNFHHFVGGGPTGDPDRIRSNPTIGYRNAESDLQSVEPHPGWLPCLSQGSRYP